MRRAFPPSIAARTASSHRLKLPHHVSIHHSRPFSLFRSYNPLLIASFPKIPFEYQQKRFNAATPVDFPELHDAIPLQPPPQPAQPFDNSSILPPSNPSQKSNSNAQPSSASPTTEKPKYKTEQGVAENIVPKQDERVPRNQVGVQLLPRKLHRQLFPPSMDPVPEIDKMALSICKDHLNQHDLKPSQASTLPQTTFDMPPLQGNDLGQHFWNLGRQVAQPWLGMAYEFAAFNAIEPPEGKEEQDSDTDYDDFRFEPTEWLNLDPMLRTPSHLKQVNWSEEPGWTKYPVLTSEDGMAFALGPGQSVPYPDKEDDVLVFDVEVMVTQGPYPVMATAVGRNAWYSWLSPWLMDRGDRCDQNEHLIPLGPSGKHTRPRLVIGHNISYDRARTLEEYTLELGSTRWLDTMSLHVATRGISSPQRPAWIKFNKTNAQKRARKLLEQAALDEETRLAIQNALLGIEYDAEQLDGLSLEALDVGHASDGEKPISSSVDMLALGMDTLADDASSVSQFTSKWLQETSKNSLADVARLHKVPLRVDKSTRGIFVESTAKEEIRDSVQHLLSYCASDVAATHQIFQKVWADFTSKCPHPATIAGVFHLGSTFLPVDDEWIEYRDRCEEKFSQVNDQVQKCLAELAEKLKVDGVKGVPMSLANQIALEQSADTETNKAPLCDPNRPRVWWEDDPWYSQLDWSPKKPKKPDGTNQGFNQVPKWYRDNVLRNKTKSGFVPKNIAGQQLLKLKLNGNMIVKQDARSWGVETDEGVQLLDASNLCSASFLKKYGDQLESGAGELGQKILDAIRSKDADTDLDTIKLWMRQLADQFKDLDDETIESDPQLATLDWTRKDLSQEELNELTNFSNSGDEQATGSNLSILAEPEWWPKWYWDLYKKATGELSVTIRSAIAPRLLKISWRGCPLYRSREHGWVYRHSPWTDTKETQGAFTIRQAPLTFTVPADYLFQRQINQAKQIGQVELKMKAGDIGLDLRAPRFFKVPHSEGDEANVGSPFSKSFIPYYEDGTLQSEHPDEVGRRTAKTALDLNAQCSYWIAVRDRVSKQMVIWDGQASTTMNYPKGVSGAHKDKPSEADRIKGLILPMVVSMGTVTRRAIENTWLTASNAKKNRVGSELKAMVKAPPGYSLVGADVDSEELWICSVMGDAQFGIHGATAIGWMTLEGTKALGTDLHSKTANILGTSRNQAKVFNYSRIYGAGIKHATHLLLKANPSMGNQEATRLAKELYMATKGQKTVGDRLFGRKFWFGGSESYVFNKLESIALSDQPQTPALDCGVTSALSKKFLGRVDFGNGRSTEEYMPSRINWVVQSSGVDYLHLLITSMEWLCKKYDIDARFMLSVHDEVRYLAKDSDRYRTALALQIANIWTRAMFAFKFQMDDLPLGCAFFAQVDIDKVLRKEADDPCVTPSHPDPIPVGEALDIGQILQHTNHGILGKVGQSIESPLPLSTEPMLDLAKPRSKFLDPEFPAYVPSTQVHRSTGQRGLYYLQAQSSKELAEIRALEVRAKASEEEEESKARSSNKCTTSNPNSSTQKNDAFDEDSWAQSCAEDFEEKVWPSGKSSAKSLSSSLGLGGRSKRPSNDGPSSSSSSSSSSPASNENNRAFSTMPVVAGSTGIESLFPKLLPKSARIPFFKTVQHRRKILWKLYRPLLKECKNKYASMERFVREMIRTNKGLTSPSGVEELVVRGQGLLQKLQGAKQGDALLQGWIANKEKRLKARWHRRNWEGYCNKYLDELKNPIRIPRMTGSLLPPTLYNPPLPRFKPVQPKSITMMIFRRRITRFKRFSQMAETIELLKSHNQEVEIWSRLFSKNTGVRVWKGFDEPLRLRKKEIEAGWQRDHARAQMVFDPKMLVRMKRAQRVRLRFKLRRKYRLSKIQAENAVKGRKS